MRDWQYGLITDARAFRLGDRLIVRVAGMLPDTCYAVQLREHVPDRNAGAEVQFSLYWKCEEREMGAVRPYAVRGEANVAAIDVRRVRITPAEAPWDVDVVALPFDPRAGPAPDGGALYTGWSRTSFEEAYRNAVDRILPRGADDLVQTRIVAQGGMHGGMAGLDDLFVTVQRVG